MIGIGTAVERATAGNRHVTFVERVHERRVVEELGAFESCEHHRQVITRLLAEAEDRALDQMQIDAAAQPDRAGQERAGGNDHPAAAGGGAGVDRGAQGRRAIDRPAGRRAESGDLEITVGK